MSTDLVSWEERLKQEAKDVAQEFRPSVGRISLKAGQMTYQDNPIPNNRIEVIVVASAFENAYYKDKYNPNVIHNPACYALGQSKKGMAPHEKVENPVNAVCEGCPYSEWGSNPEGGRGKACKEQVRLALLPVPEKMDATAIGASEMALMKLPVTSVRFWGNYVQQLSMIPGIPPWAAITRISVKPDAKTQFKVHFEHVGSLSGDDILNAVHSRTKLAQDTIMQPYEDREEEVEEEKPKGKKKY